MFSSVCDATWPTTSPVTRACAAFARQLLGDPQHQAAVDHHPQLRRHAEHHALLQLTEGHEHEPRSQLVPCQERGISRTFSWEARERMG
jgi:hypothetical protein